MSPLIEPGGEFLCAVLAQIAVLQLAVTEDLDLVAADITIFLLKHFSKQTHPATSSCNMPYSAECPI